MNHVRKSQGSKAVDILALSDNRLFLIEIKDFRGYRIESKKSLRSNEVLNEYSFGGGTATEQQNVHRETNKSGCVLLILLLLKTGHQFDNMALKKPLNF